VEPDADVEPDAPADVDLDTPAETEAEVTPPSWDVAVNVDIDGTITPVNLAGLDRTTMDGNEAVLLATIVDAAAPALPWNGTYNIIGNDGFDPLVERLGNDRAQLPFYGELSLGWVYWDAGSGQLRVNWDASLGFPGSLRVRGLDGGTIRLMTFGAGEVLVRGGGVRALVDLSTLTTVDVTDPRHPELGAQAMVPLTTVLTTAAVAGADALAYQMFGTDGYSNALDNLMPYSNLTHGYIKPADRGVVLESGFDSTGRTWHISDTVVLLGLTP
jgi:hypothetical protein